MVKNAVSNVKQRRKKILKFLEKFDCDAIVTFEPENLFYMTGFWGEAIGLLEKGGATTIISPELEVERAKSESTDCKVVKSERGDSLLLSLKSLIQDKAVCIDCQNYTTIQSLQTLLSKMTPTAEPFHQARIIKDSKEISILQKASKIIDEMFELCVNEIKPGVKESELQAILMSYAMRRGLFDTCYKATLNPLIIASGPNGALPHAQVTNRKFRDGDMIVVDLTLRYNGYISDATRTFGLGNIPEKAKEVYEIVKTAQQLGVQKVKPNVSCRTVDDACRQYIVDHGYGRYFIHSTGHGIGLDVHELPSISYKNPSKLKNGMAITVEPGVYLPKKFGIRIEDSLIVTQKPKILHKFSKDLILL